MCVRSLGPKDSNTPAKARHVVVELMAEIDDRLDGNHDENTSTAQQERTSAEPALWLVIPAE